MMCKASESTVKCNLFEVLALSVTMVVTIAMFSLPTILYLANRSEDTLEWKVRAQILYDALQNCNSEAEANTTDYNAGPGIGPNRTRTCTTLSSNNPCFEHVQASMMGSSVQRPVSPSNTLLVTSRMDNSLKEDLLNQLIEMYITPSCKSNGFPFYCNYLYSPCTEEVVVEDKENFERNMRDSLLTAEKCEEVKTETCAEEFTKLSNFVRVFKEYSLIPDCSSFKSVNASAPVLNSTTGPQRDSNLTCHPDYVEVCNLCLLSCKSTVDLPTLPGTNKAINDLLGCILFSLILVLSIVFAIVSIFKKKILMKFPTILLFYTNFCIIVMAVLLLIGFFFGDNIYCGFPDFIRSLLSAPTPLCSITGFLFLFALLSLFSMWDLHLGIILVMLTFPFYGERVIKQKLLLIHFVSVPLVLLLSLIPSIAVLASVGYSISTLPPFVCMPAKPDASFYALCLPASVLLCILVVFCILIVLVLHKNMKKRNGAVKTPGSKKEFLSTPELKILLLGIVSGIAGVCLLGRYSYSLISLSEYSQLVLDDGTCHLQGDNSGHPCAERNYLVPQAATAILSYFVLLSVPVMHVIFVFGQSSRKRLVKFFGSRLPETCLSCFPESRQPSQQNYEEAKHEEVKHEEVKREDVKHEEVKHDEVKHEEGHEEVNHEEVKHEEVRHEEVNHEEVKHEEVKHEEAEHTL